MYHKAVFLNEAVMGLNITENGTYVDATFGGGGHSRTILNALGANGKVYAFDRDLDAAKNTIADDRFTLIHENFKNLKDSLNNIGIFQVNGILADFGISSHQIDIAERGFSTRANAELDMRMDRNESISAKHIINEYEQNELATIFKVYGELKNASAIAKAIIAKRQEGEIATTEALMSILQRFSPKGKEHKFMAQVFQAIRIEVNQEIEAIEAFLAQTSELLVKGGRLSVISYHSLEDRLVKRFMRDGVFEGTAQKDFYGNKLVPFKSIDKMATPSDEELAANPRSRSAKLRIAERI